MWYQNLSHFKSVCGHEVNGSWYPRVTKILDIKSKPGLDTFFREVGNYLDAENIKNKSAEEGTAMHNIIEKLILGEEVSIPQSIEAAVSAFRKFKGERKIEFRGDFVERQIWSFRHRYAGTIDALAYIDGKCGVLDIKTSAGFYPEYNLQTAAYLSALQEFSLRKTLNLTEDVTTRWILRIDQYRICARCSATVREKGGRAKIKAASAGHLSGCGLADHDWGEPQGVVELREFPYNTYKDMKAFVAAKILWEWENEYWLKQAGYL